MYSLKGKMFIRSPKENAKIFSNENHNGPMFDSTLEFFLVSQLSHFTRQVASYKICASKDLAVV